MRLCELITIEDRFQLAGSGLTLVPDFPAAHGQWKNIVVDGFIIKPDGKELAATIKLALVHFYFFDASQQHPWRIVISLPDMQKADIPSGSKVMVEQSVKDMLLASIQ